MEDTNIKSKLEYICNQFRIPGELILYRWIPSGHINTAYYVALYDGREVRQYIAQMVNQYVFKDPVAVMRNIDLVTGFIMESEPTLERRRRLHFHHTEEGNNYLYINDNGESEFWRLYNYIENSKSFESFGGNKDILRKSGKAFGKFLRQLRDFDAEKLTESIPHFHDTRFRIGTFEQGVAEDPLGRVEEVREDIDFVLNNRDFACTLCRQIDDGKLPVRVTHNDTKTNNILFDKDTLEPLVIIDLDTCMPGIAAYDFGDAVRSSACTTEEDEKNTDLVKLDIDFFEEYSRGYLSETAGFLTEEEVDSLVTGVAVIAYELGMRFLGDYISGDQYFRIDYTEHNLVRARAQLALHRDVMKKLPELREKIRRIYIEERENFFRNQV